MKQAKNKIKFGRQEFAHVYRSSVHQHAVSAKTKEETDHLPYELSFPVQAETMQGNEVATRVLAINGADETYGMRTNSTQGFEIIFGRERCRRLNTTEEGSYGVSFSPGGGTPI